MRFIQVTAELGRGEGGVAGKGQGMHLAISSTSCCVYYKALCKWEEETRNLWLQPGVAEQCVCKLG